MSKDDRNKRPFYDGVGKRYTHGSNTGEWTRRDANDRFDDQDPQHPEKPAASNPRASRMPYKPGQTRPERLPYQPGQARPERLPYQPSANGAAPIGGRVSNPINSGAPVGGRENRDFHHDSGAPVGGRVPSRDFKQTSGGTPVGGRVPGRAFKPATGTRSTASPSRPVYQDAFEPAPSPAPVHAPVFAPAPEYAQAPSPFGEPDVAAENLLVGRNPIREAIKAGRDMEKLLVAKGDLSGSAREIIAKAREAHIVVQEVDRARLDAIYPNHQGMIAYVSAAQYATMDELYARAEESGEPPFFIILDGITDPHNLGAIIRTAECVGAHGVILAQRRSVGLTPAAVKSAAGATEYMKIARVVNISRTIEEIKSRNIWVIGASMEGQPASKTDLSGPIALVIGAEGEGLSQLVKQNCDLLVKLPMRGNIQSLNASVAAGVLMYAVRTARGD